MPVGICFEKQHKKLVIVVDENLCNATKSERFLSEVVANIDEISFNFRNSDGWNSVVAAEIYEVLQAAKNKNIKIIWDNLPKDWVRMIKLALEVDRNPSKEKKDNMSALEKIGEWGIEQWQSMVSVGVFLRNATAALGRFLMGKSVMRRIDFDLALEDCGYKAVGIVCLISFMVGLILAFVGALQLKMFGAQIYVASLVAVGMIRIMGAIMTGVIMAGRTGASYAATIGTMKVNEEIDALKTMGLNENEFLVLPRVLSLVVAMPILTMIADIVGILGGAFVAVLALDISPVQYWNYSVAAFGLKNFWVGIFHGFVYAFIIAVTGCYYGINCDRDADGVGKATTKSVVTSIVIMVVVTGVLTVVFQALGV